MKKNLNFLNKIFVIKQPYSKKKEWQFVYFSNGYVMGWHSTDWFVFKYEHSKTKLQFDNGIFQFENGIANHEQLNDRVFLENAIKAKYHGRPDERYANYMIKNYDNKALIKDFIKGYYTYISPLECKRLDKNLLKIIEYQVNRLDKGQELVEDYNEYLKLI